MAGTKTTTRAPTITHWQGKILPIGLPSAQVLQCSTPGSVSRWTGGGSRGRPPLFFQPVHCYFQRRNNEGGGEDGGEGGEEGEATSSWELTAPSFTFSTGCREPRLRQAQMDSGGLVVFGFLAALQHGTTIFLICEFLRFVHNESFTGLDLVGGGSSVAAY